jgi:hypothetical protein
MILCREQIKNVASSAEPVIEGDAWDIAHFILAIIDTASGGANGWYVNGQEISANNLNKCESAGEIVTLIEISLNKRDKI